VLSGNKRHLIITELAETGYFVVSTIIITLKGVFLPETIAGTWSGLATSSPKCAFRNLIITSSCLKPLSASAKNAHFLMRHDAWSCAVWFSAPPLFCPWCSRARRDELNDATSCKSHIASYIPCKHQKRSKNILKTMRWHFVIRRSNLTRYVFSQR